MKLFIVGLGKMGNAIRAEALRRGHEIAGAVDEAENTSGAGITATAIRDAAVAVEFTSPSAAPANLERLMRLGIPTVTGTTGWTAELPRIKALAEQHGGGLLHATNFSIGAHLFFRAAQQLAQWLRDRPEFDVQILERHHREKKDAPSGTAVTLQTMVRQADPSRPYPITSIRQGWHPGCHALIADAAQETVTIEHAARDRAVFATGALVAAEWMVGRRGVFTFEDVLFGGSQ